MRGNEISNANYLTKELKTVVQRNRNRTYLMLLKAKHLKSHYCYRCIKGWTFTYENKCDDLSFKVFLIGTISLK